MSLFHDSFSTHPSIAIFIFVSFFQGFSGHFSTSVSKYHDGSDTVRSLVIVVFGVLVFCDFKLFEEWHRESNKPIRNLLDNMSYSRFEAEFRIFKTFYNTSRKVILIHFLSQPEHKLFSSLIVTKKVSCLSVGLEDEIKNNPFLL